MRGPFDLNETKIDVEVSKTSSGNYALGYKNKESVFIVQYVGRSDNDLNDRLKKHLKKHPKFKFSYATSPEAAFKKECQNYHDFGGPLGKLENKIHPDRPKETDYKCPVCDIFG